LARIGVQVIATGRREIGFGANEVELGQCLPHCRVLERLWSERKRSVVEKFISFCELRVRAGLS